MLYVLGTLGYSLWWKRLLFFDVVVLALLHVRTGQFLPGRGRFWEGRIEFGQVPGSTASEP